MRVILKQPVSHLGQPDDVVEVSDGYARNFLLPQGLVDVATPKAVGEVERRREVRERKRRERREALLAAAAALDGASVTLTAAADESGTLFGSVGTAEIAEALTREKSVIVTEDDLVLAEPIKRVGEYRVSLNFGEERAATVTVTVGASAKQA